MDEWVSGWCPSSSVCGIAVVCAAVVLPSAVVWLVPCSSHCSTHQYCCRVVHCSSPGVWRVGGSCVSVLFVWWGILCLLPLTLVVGGAVVDGGVPSWMVGGMVSEGRGAVLLASLSCVWCPRLRVGVPLVVYPVALLNGGGWYVLWCPRVRIGSSPFSLSPFPSRVASPLSFACCCVWCVR